MRNKGDILSVILNVFSCVILFVCLGLAVSGGTFLFDDLREGFDLFLLFDRHRIAIAFILIVASLILLYFQQKILFKKQTASIHTLLQASSRMQADPLDSRIKQIYEFAPIGVMETSRDGKILFLNPMAVNIIGFASAKELMETVNHQPGGIKNFYVDGQARDQLIRQLYDERQGHCKVETRFYHQSGKTIDVALHLFLRYDVEREEECVFVFFQDITERVAFERQLKESEARYRDLIDKANSPIVRMDSQGRIRYMNECAQRAFGYALEEVVDRHVVGVLFDPVMINEAMVADFIQDVCHRPDRVSSREIQNIRKDGQKFWVSWSSKAVLDQNGNDVEILAIGTDVTERKDLERSLQEKLGIETLLGQISSKLANADADEIEEAIAVSLDRINDFFHTTCGYACFFNESGFVDHCYVRGFPDEVTGKNFIDRFFLSASAWWFEILADGHPVLLDCMRDLPDELESGRQIAAELGLGKALVTPVFHCDRFVGFIGLHAAVLDSAWGDQHAGMLKVCGEMFLNVLEKKKFYMEIAQSKERLDMAVRGAYLGMYDWDIVSGEVVFNDIWFRMLGYSPSEFPHHVETWKKLMHPDDAEWVFRTLNEYLNGAKAFYHAEFRLKTKDDSWKWISAQGHIIRREEDGTPVRMVGLQRDVTDLKLSEVRLQQQKELVESLIENMPVGIFAKDIRNGFRMLFWNRHMEELFGMKRYDVLGKNDYELFDRHLADLYVKDDAEVVRTKMIKSGIRERVQTTHGEKWVQTVKVPVLNENGEVQLIFGILEDLTTKESLEISLRHTQKMQAIGQLAAGVAHEIKNPLAIILLAAEWLARNKEVCGHEAVEKKILMIKDASQRADKVIVELLKFSRLADSDMERVDLHEVIDAAYFLAHNRSKVKYIDFQKMYCQGPLFCHGNAVLLEQVFVNLFNNAIDAIERFGTIVVRTRIRDAANGAKQIVIEVEDNGSGIPEEILPKIFDPFYTTKDAGNGTGLGLSTVFMILEKHSGHIRVDTSVQNGTRFVITLPIYDSAAHE